MVEEDLPAARQLWTEADGVELSEGDSVEELTRYLRRNPGTSFVAVADGVLIGAVLAGHDGRRGLLYHLAVARGRQNAGLGRALVERAITELKAAGVVRVLILVSRENALGKLFWEKRGWEPLTLAEPMGRDL
jgi:ribosomal protein S18 acetylase RimI-like enzyme